MKRKHRGYAWPPGAWLVPPGVPVGPTSDAENRWRVVRRAVGASVIASCVDLESARSAARLIGGSP